MLIEAHRDNKNTRQQSDWKDFLQLYFTKITVYTVILIFISYIGTYNILPYCRSVIQPPFGDLSAAAVTLLFMSPFRFIGRCRDTAFHVAVFGGTDGKPFGTARFDGRFMV